MSAEHGEAYWLDVRDPSGLFAALARDLAGNAHMSIMGRIKGLTLEEIPGAAKAETIVLKRQTLFSIPREQFIVLPLELETVETILGRIPAECWDDFRITHVEIEKDGTVQFSGCDYFDVNSTWVGDAVSENLLTQLVSDGILNRFQRDIFVVGTFRLPVPGVSQFSKVWNWIRGKRTGL